MVNLKEPSNDILFSDPIYYQFAFIITIAPFALILMMIIVVQDLDGARDGMLYVTTPHWEYLLRPSTWAAAGLQAIWTLSLGYGSYAHLGYRNKANSNPFWYSKH